MVNSFRLLFPLFTSPLRRCRLLYSTLFRELCSGWKFLPTSSVTLESSLIQWWELTLNKWLCFFVRIRKHFCFCCCNFHQKWTQTTIQEKLYLSLSHAWSSILHPQTIVPGRFFFTKRRKKIVWQTKIGKKTLQQMVENGISDGTKRANLVNLTRRWNEKAGGENDSIVRVLSRPHESDYPWFRVFTLPPPSPHRMTIHFHSVLH